MSIRGLSGSKERTSGRRLTNIDFFKRTAVNWLRHALAPVEWLSIALAKLSVEDWRLI